jgi:hypothetical protein
VSTEAPASLCQRGLRSFDGSIRCAAADSQAETLGAALSCRTRPVRSTRGAAQVRATRQLPRQGRLNHAAATRRRAGPGGAARGRDGGTGDGQTGQRSSRYPMSQNIHS